MPLFSNASPCTLHKSLYTAFELLLGSLALIIIGNALPLLMLASSNWWVAGGFYAFISILILIFWPHGALGWANRVTLIRGILVAIVAAGLLAGAFKGAIWQWLLIAVIALLLDGVDGWVARYTRSHSSFGARFDMELDALLIMLLCVGLWEFESLGAWVLLIGGMRYLFVMAGWRLKWLTAPLFASFRRKVVCVWQVAALLLALTPLSSPLMANLLALSALVSLVYSFGVDVRWLYVRSTP
ncbi:CDP-alcohol phosphatidyltransferase family protein [Vreelandella profundi]|uniref:CDP-alcohol phosphatidyltransferase family protein n=1 Tax=Vreelandella profundi TaxID=2852117 RepID=UPI001EF01521|nr:CDP-alcohol phosphatidyltransferase family protein [Halomonas profundi]